MKYNGINISTQGVQGATGSQGTTGVQGITGAVGSQGTSGNTGAQGISRLRGYHNAFPTSSGDIISYPLLGFAVGTGNVPINTLFVFPFIPVKNTSYSELSFYLSGTNVTTGASGRLLIYSDLNGVPNTKLYESADLSFATSGRKIASTSGTFLAGVTYWLGYYCNTLLATQVIPLTSVYSAINIGLNSSLNSNLGYLLSTTYRSAPTTFGAGTPFNGQSPNFAVIIYITIA